jgi:hypothetical protein
MMTTTSSESLSTKEFESPVVFARSRLSWQAFYSTPLFIRELRDTPDYKAKVSFNCSDQVSQSVQCRPETGNTERLFLAALSSSSYNHEMIHSFVSLLISVPLSDFIIISNPQISNRFCETRNENIGFLS